MNRQYPRTLYLPPSGRPRWVCPPGGVMALTYLSWGRRFFGKSPIPVSRHPGWIYVFVQRGHPQLVLTDRRVKLSAGDVVIIHPDCPSGWTDEPVGEAEVLAWTWREQPTCEGCRPEPGRYRQWTLDRVRRRELMRLHADTRREIERPDRVTPVAVANLQSQLDVLLARATNRSPAVSDPALRMELATRWMTENLTDRHPVRGLCEYLQVSPATLVRLFQRHLRQSPQEHHLYLRLSRARELLESGKCSVKQAAYEVGYRHPHDFTRAFTRWAKYPPNLFSGPVSRRK